MNTFLYLRPEGVLIYEVGFEFQDA